MGSRDLRYRFGEDLSRTSPVTASKAPDFSTAVPPHTLAKAGLSDGEYSCYGGSATICRTPDNERLVEHEHRPGTGRQHALSGRVPTFELAIPLANGSGEVPLQVELKTI
jgi:hypothetical protein